MSKEPIIAIVGRPNVGKSTLFNRIAGIRKAVVEDEPGVTRDRNYVRVDCFSIPFLLVDTGGFDRALDDELRDVVVEQTLCAVEEADITICLFDIHAGVQPGDIDIVEVLRPLRRKVLYVANKCDGIEQAVAKADFYALGLSNILNVSGLYGRGVKDLVESILQELPDYKALKQSAEDKAKQLKEKEAEARQQLDAMIDHVDDMVEEPVEESHTAHNKRVERTYDDVKFSPVFVPGESEGNVDDYIRSHKIAPAVFAKLKDVDKEDFDGGEELEEVLPEIDRIRVAIVGRPNVGKSTLLNTLTGEQRAITSSIAGTTRDSLDMEIVRDGQLYELIDTAGLRKKARISDRIERFSVLRAIDAMREADVAVIVIDGVRGPSDQDTKIVGLAHDLGKGIVLAVNKWDLVEKDHKTVREYTERIRNSFKYARYASIVFISALSGRRCPRVIEAVKDAAVQRIRRVSTGKLNAVLKRAHGRMTPPGYRGRPIKIFYAAQVSAGPPSFVLFFNYTRSLHFSYLRFLKNAIRDEFGFAGTDIRLLVRKRGARER